MSVLYKLWLTFSSLMLTMTVYLVKENVLLNKLGIFISDETCKLYIEELPKYLSYIAYFFIVVCCTFFSMLLARCLSTEQIGAGSITAVEPANDAFLPSYLGYFFVALSVPNLHTLVYVFGTIFIFTYFSKISYFNPLFLLFGYKFFHLTDASGLKIVVITRQELKVPSEVGFVNLKRINNYTFITWEND